MERSKQKAQREAELGGRWFSPEENEMWAHLQDEEE